MIHVIADLAIACAYFTMPVVLILGIRKHRVKQNGNRLLLAVFILFMFGGAVNFLMHAVELYGRKPYRIDTLVDVCGAVACWTATVMLAPSIARFYADIVKTTQELRIALDAELASRSDPSLAKIRLTARRLEALALKLRVTGKSTGRS